MLDIAANRWKRRRYPRPWKFCPHSAADADMDLALAQRAPKRSVSRIAIQVADLPPIEAWITEYQCFKVECPSCGQATRSALPEEARDQMGARLTALVAYLTVVCRMPRRVVQRLLE